MVWESLHRLHFLLDELVKAALVLQANAVEAAAADDFLLESFEEIGAFLGSNEHVNFVHTAQGVQKFLEEYLSEKTRCSRNENPFALISFLDWHQQ